MHSQLRLLAPKIEVGHLSNPKEEHHLRDPTYRARLAQGLVKGIDQYFSTKGKKAPARPPRRRGGRGALIPLALGRG